jgi:hypothetical protein
VEVQWSSQPDEELRQRQQRYAEAKVRALWLIRCAGFPVTKEIPAAVVREGGTEQYEVLIPTISGASLRREYDWAYRNLSAEAFLDAAFSGRLRWGLKAGEPISWVVEAATTDCWKCGARTTPVTGIVVDASRMKAHLSIDDFETDPDLLNEVLPTKIRLQRRVGEVKLRFSRTQSGAYLSNACFECGELLGQFYQHQYINEAAVCHVGTGVVDERWMRLIKPRFARHWRVLDVEPTEFAGDADGVIGDDDS